MRGRPLARSFFALAAGLVLLVAGDVVATRGPGPDALFSTGAPRLAHGSVQLLRVIDALALPDADGSPLLAVDGETAYVETARDTVVLDLPTGEVTRIPTVPRRSPGSDAHGRAYVADADAGGAVIRRVDPDGRTSAIAAAPFAEAAAWGWSFAADGAVYAVAWSDDGEAIRARVYRLLAPDRDE